MDKFFKSILYLCNILIDTIILNYDIDIFKGFPANNVFSKIK